MRRLQPQLPPRGRGGPRNEAPLCPRYDGCSHSRRCWPLPSALRAEPLCGVSTRRPPGQECARGGGPHPHAGVTFGSVQAAPAVPVCRPRPLLGRASVSGPVDKALGDAHSGFWKRVLFSRGSSQRWLSDTWDGICHLVTGTARGRSSYSGDARGEDSGRW